MGFAEGVRLVFEGITGSDQLSLAAVDFAGSREILDRCGAATAAADDPEFQFLCSRAGFDDEERAFSEACAHQWVFPRKERRVMIGFMG